MFNKRDNPPSSPDESPRPERVRSEAPPSSGGKAVIGASIHVDGTLKGEEDLLIEGKVKGTVELKKHSVTIGASGEVKADVYAHTIYVDGRMEGNLVASERIVIRKSAEIRGSITAPRVSLEDGARFNGTIDMDPNTEALKQGFSSQSSSQSARPSAAPTSGKPETRDADKSAQSGA